MHFEDVLSIIYYRYYRLGHFYAYSRQIRMLFSCITLFFNKFVCPETPFKYIFIII